MTISQTAYVDLLVKKLYGVDKTDLPGAKSPSNEAIASPLLNRGDKTWTQAASIPTTAAAVSNIVQAYTTTSLVECTGDITTTPVSSVYPTWKTGLTNWIPPEFDTVNGTNTYRVAVYYAATGAAASFPTGFTQIYGDGSGGVGEYYFDYQAGTLNFIGGTIPAGMSGSSRIYVVGYRYVGLTGVTNLPNITLGTGTAAGTLTTNGAYNLLLNTNAGTNSGTITIAQGVNGNIALTPNGTGNVVLSGHLTLEGVTATGATGTGRFVFDTSPTISGAILTNHVTVESVTSTGATGTGNIVFSASPTLTGTLTVTGDETVTGTITSNNLTVNNNATVSGTLYVTGDIVGGPLRTDDMQIVGNRIETTATNSNFEINTVGTGSIELLANSNVTGTFGVSGLSTLAQAQITDLTSGRITYASTSGRLVDSGNLTFSGTLLTVTGTATVTSLATLAQAQVSDLTSGRVIFAGTSGRLQDSSALTFSNGTLNVGTSVAVSGTGGDITMTGGSITGVGSISTVGLAVSNNATISGNLTVIGDIIGGPLRTDDIQIVGNRIETTATNSNFEINTVGTGSIELLADTNITGNLGVSGNVDVTGNITLGGNIRIGDTTLDTVTVIADFTSDLVPDVSNTFDIGTSTKQWRVVNAAEFNNNVIRIDDNTIKTTVSNANLELRANGVGTVELQTNTNVTGTFGVSGLSTLAQVQVSDLTSGRLTYAGTSGRLIDSTNLTFNGSTLTVTGDETVTGTITTTNLSVNNATVSGTLYVTGDIVGGPLRTDDIQIIGNRIETTSSNSNFEINTVGTGSIELLANSKVTGTFEATGLSTLAQAQVTDLTSGRLTYASTNGRLVDSPSLTFNGSTLSVTGTFGVTGLSTLAMVQVSDLTSGRITYASTSGRLIDSANLTFNGTTLTVTGNETVTGTATLGSLLVNGFTTFTGPAIASDTLTVAGTLYVTGDIVGGPLRTDDIQIVGNRIETTATNSNFEINTTGTGSIELLANSNVTGTFGVSGLATLAQAQVTDLTSGRVTYASTSGRLIDSANFTFNGFTLTVTGNETVTGTATLGNLVVNSTTTLSGPITASDNLTVGGTLYVTGDIVGGPLRTDDIQIVGNRIETTATNSNFEINTVGTGSIELLANTNVTGNLGVSGNVDVTGNITLGGNIRIGDTTLDSVTVVADFTSDLVPDASNSYDLGTANKSWRNVYAGQIDVDGIRIDTTTISTVDSNANLELTPSGTGIVYISGTGAVRIPSGNTLQRPATGQAGYIRYNSQTNNIEAWNGVTFAGISGGSSSDTNGDTLLTYETGGNNEDIIRFFTGIAGLTPGSSIGSVEQVQIRSTGLNVIRNLTVGNDFTVTGNATISEITTDDVRISGNRISTTQSNSNLELTGNGSGSVVVQGTLSVTRDLFVVGTSTLSTTNISDLTVNNDFTVVGNARISEITTDDVRISGNRISTTQSNSNLELIANGTGQVVVQDTLNVAENLLVSGTSTLSTTNISDLTVNNDFTVVGNARISEITTDDVRISGNRISTTQSNSNLELISNGTGLVSVQDTLSVAEDLFVAGTSTLAKANISDLTNGRIHIYQNIIENTQTNDDLIIRANGTGRVIIDGSGTSENSGNVFATDPLLTFNSGISGIANTYDAGFIINRGTNPNVGFVWSEAGNEFRTISTLEQGTVKGPVSITSYKNISTNTIKLNSETATKLAFVDSSKYVRSLDTGRSAIVDGTLTFNSAAQLNLPAGTNSQRPGSATTGSVRYNTDSQIFEGYGTAGWQAMGVGVGTSVDYQSFTGDGTTYQFTLQQTPLSAGSVMVVVNGIVQQPGISYQIIGNVLSFSDTSGNTFAPEYIDAIDVRFLSKPSVSSVREYNYTGDGSNVTFGVDFTINSVAEVMVFVNNIYQDSAVYTYSGTNVIFTQAPYANERVCIVHLCAIIAPNVPTVQSAQDDAIAFSIALG